MAERQYPRDHGRVQAGPGLPPVTKWLLMINAVIFLLDLLSEKLVPNHGSHLLTRLGMFSVDSAIFEGHVWKFITFQFLHGSVGHILFNSVALYFGGPIMERWWGKWKFLIFYLLCGIGGALLYSILGVLGIVGLGSGIVGASAGIFGILMGMAIVAPDMRVALLFPPVVLSMRRMAWVLLGIAVVSIIIPIFGNEGGEAGHLGGAMVGILLVRFPRLLSWAGGKEPGVAVMRPNAFERPFSSKIRPRTHVNFQRDSEIDQILDKVSRDGFGSLTEEERQKLHTEHERLRSSSTTDQ